MLAVYSAVASETDWRSCQSLLISSAPCTLRFFRCHFAAAFYHRITCNYCPVSVFFAAICLMLMICLFSRTLLPVFFKKLLTDEWLSLQVVCSMCGLHGFTELLWQDTQNVQHRCRSHNDYLYTCICVQSMTVNSLLLCGRS